MFTFYIVQGCILGLCFASYYDEVNPPRIYSLHIRSEIQFRFATTLVSSRVANPKNHTQDAVFDITLPEEAFISNFTLEIDGVIYPGIVKDKDEAKAHYDKAKKRGQSAGLVSQRPRDTRRFKIEVAIAAHSKVYFNLTYQELLKRVKGAYEHKIYINPGQPVDDVQISVALLESRDITKLVVPPLREFKDLLTNDHVQGEEMNALAVITRPNARSAYITYNPTVADQSDGGLIGQFVVKYDVERSLDGGDVLVVNGYFVHFLAPEVKKAVPKDVLFILDVSASMRGTKMKQMKEAMYIIMDDLKEGDRFNIITFDDKLKFYTTNMTDVTKRNVLEAKVYIKDDVYADGWTNINDAILEGVEIMRQFKEDEERSPVILFLTDGEPTAGEQNDVKILQNIQRVNEGDIPLFTLAFGTGADWSLVKKMAEQNDGVGRKIYEDSDADLQISGFYDELSVTLLNNVTVKYLGDEVDADSITKSNFKNYFQGSEIVVAGKLVDSNAPTVDLEIFGDGAEGSITLTVDKDSNIINTADTDLMKVGDFEEITEKLWAFMTIKQLLKRATIQLNATASVIMKERAKELALQYGFVTSMTSMVVTKPDIIDDRPTTPAPTTTTIAPKTFYGRGGAGGGWGGGGGGDPHYLVRVGNVEHPLCFDVKSVDGEIHNLITEPKHSIIINSQIIGSGKVGLDDKLKTFIGQISIQMKHHVIIVTPEAILYDLKMYTWKEERVQMFGGHELTLLDKGHLLSIRFKFGAEVLIKRHARHENVTGDVSYLNIYVNEEDGFSKYTTGLLGQFVNGQKHVFLKKDFLNDGGKHMAKFQVKEGIKFLGQKADTDVSKPESHIVRANLVQRSEVVAKGTELCWMVHKTFETALLGDRATFVIDDFVKR